MSIQSGVIAILVNCCELTGSLVEVVGPAPSFDFQLPDNHWHVPCGEGDWIIKSIGAPFAAMRGEVVISVRSTYYGVLHQRYIKPLPGEQELDVIEFEKELTNAKH